MKEKICPGCGKKFTGRSKYHSYECALPAMAEAVRQLREKEGPIYEKWKASLKAATERL